MSIVQQKYVRPCARNEYANLPRFPVIVASWNTFDVNVSGIIRTAEAFRIERVSMIRKPRKMSAAVKTQRWQPVSYGDTEDVISDALLRGYRLVALEQTNKSIPLYEFIMPEKAVFLVGNECDGLPQRVLDMAHVAVEIPQHGFVGSLNVVTAASIALYEWMRQRRG